MEGKMSSRIVDGGFLEFVDDSRNLEYISGEVDSRTVFCKAVHGMKFPECEEDL